VRACVRAFFGLALSLTADCCRVVTIHHQFPANQPKPTNHQPTHQHTNPQRQHNNNATAFLRFPVPSLPRSLPFSLPPPKTVVRYRGIPQLHSCTVTVGAELRRSSGLRDYSLAAGCSLAQGNGKAVSVVVGGGGGWREIDDDGWCTPTAHEQAGHEPSELPTHKNGVPTTNKILHQLHVNSAVRSQLFHRLHLIEWRNGEMETGRDGRRCSLLHSYDRRAAA